MERVTLKPTRSKKIVSWLTMSCIILIISLVINPNILADPITAIIVLMYLFGACLIFNLILYNLPYFRVELTKTHYIGPDFPGLGWQRAEIPIEEIDLQSVFTSLQWLGFYIIKTKGIGKIALWCFDENQYKQFTDIIIARKRTIKQ